MCRQELVEKERKAHAHLAIFPCRLRVLPAHMFKTRDPIICGVSVEAGCLRVGTPLCVPSRERIALGTVSSIEVNNKPVDSVRIGQEACIKIENTTGEAPRMFDRHFTAEDAIVSRVRVRVRMHTPPSLLQISRESIDVCKQYFRDDLTKPDWALVVELKKVLDIM
jgi:translation initiation factor 5B